MNHYKIRTTNGKVEEFDAERGEGPTGILAFKLRERQFKWFNLAHVIYWEEGPALDPSRSPKTPT